MKNCCLIIPLLFTVICKGQDLSGTWEGTGGMGAPYLKLVIVKNGQQYIGYTYDDGSIGYCKANFAGKFDPTSRKLKGKGMGFIEKTFGHGQSVFNLTYSNIGNNQFLRGLAWPKSIASKILTLGIPAMVSLTKVSEAIDTTDFVRIRIPGAVMQAADSTNDDTITAALEAYDRLEKNIIATSKERTDSILSTITITEKKLLLKIFDNGITDGDSISILYNGKLIASRIGVTANLVEIPLLIENNHDDHKIILVAHNLGSIPPNTATIIIEAGDKKYTLFASSDLKRNASIIIRYRE